MPFSTCEVRTAGCDSTGFRQLSSFLWRTNLEVCILLFFVLVDFMIGHFHCRDFPIIRAEHFRFCHNRRRETFMQKFKLFVAGSLIFTVLFNSFWESVVVTHACMTCTGLDFLSCLAQDTILPFKLDQLVSDCAYQKVHIIFIH